MKLSDSCEMYLSALEETKHPDPGYRAKKLKRKLEKSDVYGRKLSFCQLYIVYNSDMITALAVTLANGLGSADIAEDVAPYYKNIIAEAVNKSESLSWPPIDDFLRQSDVRPGF